MDACLGKREKYHLHEVRFNRGGKVPWPFNDYKQYPFAFAMLKDRIPLEPKVTCEKLFPKN